MLNEYGLQNMCDLKFERVSAKKIITILLAVAFKHMPSQSFFNFHVNLIEIRFKFLNTECLNV